MLRELKGLATGSDELVESFERISTFTGDWEQEPNDQITDGNPVSLGMRIRGEFVSVDDRDYFKVVTPEGEPGKVRVILRKLAPDGMHSTITVYDEAERNLGSNGARGKDQATFAFDGELNITYFVLASPYSESEVGPYELEIRRE